MQLTQCLQQSARWFGFGDYQNCHPIEIGNFAFPNMGLPYVVKIWVSATRWTSNGEWVYRYFARYQIIEKNRILTDQRGLDNMFSVGDVLKSAYRWLANNGL